MRILVGKTFGLGNAVLSLPMVKALCTLGQVEVLVGQTSDDFGAGTVFSMLKASAFNPIGFCGPVAAATGRYDVAVMSIPFDGRWENGRDFVADRVLDGRKRPDNVDRLGFDMWKKHEVLYQMENASELGYSGDVPASTFFSTEKSSDDLVYLGIGYKRDSGGFGLSKHFGVQGFISLMRAIRERRPSVRFISTGSMADFVQTGLPVMNGIGDHKLYQCDPIPSLPFGMLSVGSCRAYIGNDTGMMHVAASRGIPTHGIFLNEDLVRKNHPWTDRWAASLLGDSIDSIADKFVDLIWEK